MSLKVLSELVGEGSESLNVLSELVGEGVESRNRPWGMQS